MTVVLLENAVNSVISIYHFSGKGLAANLVTGFLVIFASRLGVPFSTTHVSVVSKTAHLGMFSKVFSSWILTLPIAAKFSCVTYLLLPK